MESIQPQFIGAPCGSHGPYTFYKAVKFKKDGIVNILKLGEFFYFKILDDFPVCIGEIQLLWEEKGTNQLLTSVRLYFQPQDTPGEIQNGFEIGEDEVLAMSEKLIVSVEDLVVRLLPPSAPWAYGRPFRCFQDLPTADSDVIMDATPSLCDAFTSPSNLLKITFDEVDKERAECGMDPDQIVAPVAVMTYARYCRYRTVLKRVESLSDAWLKNVLVMAIGGITSLRRGVKVMFCREVFEYRDLEDLDFHLEHLAPNLKGRPRKRKMKKDDSDSNGYGSDHSSNTSGSAPKVKSMRIQSRSENRNGITVVSKARVSEEERLFLKKLYKFMASHNTPIDRLPSLGFKQIDLYEFYKAAKRLGGYQKICENRQWKNLYDELGGHASSTSAATCTRRHYERLILPYETHLRKVQQARRRAASQKPAPALPSPPMKDAAQNTQPPVQNGQMKDKAEKRVDSVEKPVDSDSVKKESNGMKVAKAEDLQARTSTATNTGTEAPPHLLPAQVKTPSTPTPTPSPSPQGSVSAPKVFKVEDMYHVEMKPTFVQRASPLEVPVIPHRSTATTTTTPIIAPHKQTAGLPHQAESLLNKAGAPRGDSHSKSSPFSSLALSSHTTTTTSPSSSSLRNDRFRKQQQPASSSGIAGSGSGSQLFSPLLMTAPSHHHPLPVASSAGLSLPLSQVPSAHQRTMPSLFHHLKLTREHLLLNSKLMGEASASSAAVAVPLSHDPHVKASQPVLFQTLPEPSPAHCSYVKAMAPPDYLPPAPLQVMPCRRHREMRTNPVDRFPHPNQVLSRIHIQHQNQRPASSSSEGRRSSSGGGGGSKVPHPGSSSHHHSSLSSSAATTMTKLAEASSHSHFSSPLSLLGTSSLLSNGKDSGGGHRRVKSSHHSAGSKNHHHHLPGPSSSSSSSSFGSGGGGGSSVGGGQGSGSSLKDSHAERMAEALQQHQQQQSEVMLQSALFGAQFTALPRPTQPAETYLPALLTPHAAFALGGGQAAFPGGSATSSHLAAMYQQLNPAAQAQLMAYSEEMQRKALLSSAPFMMAAASLQGAFAQPALPPPAATKDSSSHHK